MKFVAENTPGKKLILPRVALTLAHFGDGDNVEIKIGHDIVIVTKKRMNAAELIRAVNALHELCTELTDHLINICGECHGCMDVCAMESMDEGVVALPEELLEKAGISGNSTLWACADNATHTITFGDASKANELTDIPDWLMDHLMEHDICFGVLDKHLACGDIIYGD